MSYLDQTTYRAREVLVASAIYSVFLDGAPINLRDRHTLLDYPGPKYTKVSFSNPAHAINLAERLNAMFRTTGFVAVAMHGGTPITRKRR